MSDDDSCLILLLHVDDILIAGVSMKEISILKSDMAKAFDMKDLGVANQILGMWISRDQAVH